MADLFDKRKSYESGHLDDSGLKDNPMELFRDWFLEADEHPQIAEANAMAISTVENHLIPRTRMVLLKQYTWEGFVFYSNYNSRKGKALAENPNICIHFFWAPLERQVIINGKIEKLASNLSDGYFHSRPRGSQLGSMVSPQSQVIESRAYLDNKLKELEEETNDLPELKRPEHWGGYLVRPEQMEFWQGRPNRLHDRILYTLQDNFDWKTERLAP